MSLLYLEESLTYAHRDLTVIVSRSNCELVTGAIQAQTLAAQTPDLQHKVGDSGQAAYLTVS